MLVFGIRWHTLQFKCLDIVKDGTFRAVHGSNHGGRLEDLPSAFPGNAPDFPEMGYLELAPKGISHHMAPVYREARLGEWTFSEAADMPCGHQEMVQVLFIKRCGTKAKGAKIAQCQWVSASSQGPRAQQHQV